MVPFGDAVTGAAWLSSARVVRCSVKSGNERNPHLQLPAVRLGTLEKLPVISGRKVWMTSSPHGPLRVGLHTCYNGSDNGLIPKSYLSSDCCLQLDGMKSESLVIA